MVARLFRLWRLYATMDLLSLARGPEVAITYYVSDLIIGGATITATFLLAERFDGIGPWTKQAVFFLLAYALIVRGLLNTFFSYNVAHISRRVGRGQLDHMLIQPQPLWSALLTEGFAPVTGSGMLLPGALLLIWALGHFDAPVSAAWWVLFGLNLAASTAILMAFEFAWGSLAFWAPRAAEEINSHTWDLLMQLSPFPLDGIPAVAAGALVTLVPVGLVAWWPSRTLLQLDSPSPLRDLVLPVAAIVFCAVAIWIFRTGLREYGRTGSSRYLDYGHRR